MKSIGSSESIAQSNSIDDDRMSLNIEQEEHCDAIVECAHLTTKQCKEPILIENEDIVEMRLEIEKMSHLE